MSYTKTLSYSYSSGSDLSLVMPSLQAVKQTLSQGEEKAQEAFLKVFSSSSKEQLANAFALRSNLDGDVEFLPGTPPIVVLEDGFIAVRDVLGEGGNSRVYKTIKFPIRRTPTSSPCKPVSTSVLKVPKHQREKALNVKEMLNQALSPVKRKHADIPIRTFNIVGQTWSEHLRYKTTLDKMHFKDLHHALHLTSLFLKPLDSFHKRDIIHGDLKGNNIGVTESGDGVRLSDFDSLRQISGKKYKPIFTPTYADPSIFGSLLSQFKTKEGRHTKQSDMFAVGRTIERDVIRPLILQNLPPGLQKDRRFNIFHMNLFKSNREFTEDQIKQIEEKFPNRCIIKSPTTIGYFKPLSERYRTILSLLEGTTFSQQEREILKNLTHFALFSLQSSDISYRATVNETQSFIQNQIENLLGGLKERPKKRLKTE